MKKVLIIGGGQAQIGLIKAAKSLGLYTIVVGIRGDYAGYSIADKVYYEDIFDKEAVLKIAKAEKIDGISMACSDFGLETLGYVNDSLHLVGLSENAALVSANKLKMKQSLMNAGVNTSRFVVLKNDNDVEESVRSLNLPLIVKAVDLQGSRGIYICNSYEDVYEHYKKSISESRCDYCIVEEFIEGVEFGAQAFVYNNEVLFVQSHGDNVYKSNNVNVPIGHYMPLSSDLTFNSEIEDLVIKSIKALQFNNCAVNVDLILKDGIPYVIELTGRAGANYLTEMTGVYLGLDYYKMILLCSIGESAKYCYENRVRSESAIVSRMLYTKLSGIVSTIEYRDVPDIKEVDLFVNTGDVVNSFTNSRDCIGRLLCTGSSVDECNKIIDNFLEGFIITIG